MLKSKQSPKSKHCDWPKPPGNSRPTWNYYSRYPIRGRQVSHLVTGSWQALLLAHIISGVINAEFISFKIKFYYFVANHRRWAIFNLFVAPNNHPTNATRKNASTSIIIKHTHTFDHSKYHKCIPSSSCSQYLQLTSSACVQVTPIRTTARNSHSQPNWTQSAKIGTWEP